MRFVARWSVVLAFCSAVVFAAVQPAWHHAAARHLTRSASASSDATGTSSGLKSQALPPEGSSIGPGAAIAGPTVLKAVLSSPSFVGRRAPNLMANSASRALRASRLSPHLRSIPLLI